MDENAKFLIKKSKMKIEKRSAISETIDADGNLIFPDKYIPLSENPRILGKVVDHFTPIEK